MEWIFAGGDYTGEVSASSVVLLPHAPASVGLARHRLGADLRAHGIPEPEVADATLVLSELLSNAIRHARPLPGAQIQVTWTLNGGTLELAVSDGGGETEPRRAPPSPSSLGGRGLGIVDRLSHTWGVRTDSAGTTVWALLATGPRGTRRPRSGRSLSGSGLPDRSPR